MITRETGIEGLLIVEPRVFKDTRGYFFESYNHQKFMDSGIGLNFVQDNQSRSEYGVIRGLHFQKDPYAQTKLIRVLDGAIFDVAVDLREGSPTFGKWFGLEINAENYFQLMIPKGFAHGYSVLSDRTIVLYKCDEYYHPEAEGGIRFDDPDLGIDWKIPGASVKVSEKDQKLPYLKDL